jgi:signal transduction histidine kinase
VIARVRSLPGRAWDCAITALLLTFVALDVATGAFDGTAFVPCFVLQLVIALLPLVRRRAPIAAIYVWALASAALGFGFDASSNFINPILGLFIFPYNAGLRAHGRRSFAALPAICVTAAAATFPDPSAAAADLFFPIVFGTLFWLVGRAIASRSQLTAELHEAAIRAGEELERDASRAVADERRRIAREMHDVVAHSVSMMVVQAGGARRILDRDPERAIAAAELIERTGRDALTEMRHLLGLLHGEPAPEYAPQPTLARLDGLVERARAAGLPVELEVAGERPELPPGLDLAAYRVVQEALTNVIKHGGGAPTEVRVHYRPDAVEVLVSDDGDGVVDARLDGGGQGLVGMQERVRMFGGALRAGRRDDGGFAVAVRLPLEGEAEAALTAGARS